jgi:hypothetical protein
MSLSPKIDDSSSPGGSKCDEYKKQALVLYADYIALPLWQRIVGTILALTIIIDGAVLFFTLIGAFGYLSAKMQSLILEQTIQIINAAFSIICLMELPFRLHGAYLFIFSEFSNSCGTRSNETTNVITENENTKFVQKPNNCFQSELFDQYTWSRYYYYTFGILTLVKVCQIAFQFGVEYLCLAYAGPNNYEKRPPFLFALFIGFALPLGCGIGIAEGIFKGWAKDIANGKSGSTGDNSYNLNNNGSRDGEGVKSSEL